jgi:hypothetical protein
MAMSNDLSHLLLNLLGNGFATSALSTRPCGILPSRPLAASEIVKVAFSAAYRKAGDRALRARTSTLVRTADFLDFEP